MGLKIFGDVTGDQTGVMPLIQQPPDDLVIDPPLTVSGRDFVCHQRQSYGSTSAGRRLADTGSGWGGLAAENSLIAKCSSTPMQSHASIQVAY